MENKNNIIDLLKVDFEEEDDIFQRVRNYHFPSLETREQLQLIIARTNLILANHAHENNQLTAWTSCAICISQLWQNVMHFFDDSGFRETFFEHQDRLTFERFVTGLFQQRRQFNHHVHVFGIELALREGGNHFMTFIRFGSNVWVPLQSWQSEFSLEEWTRGLMILDYATQVSRQINFQTDPMAYMKRLLELMANAPNQKGFKQKMARVLQALSTGKIKYFRYF